MQRPYKLHFLETVTLDISKMLWKSKDATAYLRVGNKLIVFGDRNNDIEMFRIADCAIAVANATVELKRYATHVIDSNQNVSHSRLRDRRCQRNCGIKTLRNTCN
ncbi:hypothetical protein A6770_00565 [Nostoc minutum NIES-26]|uniref:Uncharacterized protein n=1 Tax=Nostoc minutum NIES-26 TaxID=1844469 RepID=A0A367QXQ7_9NOSO|nr:hypothetical protein A6770_00565 [Nostoc minutum NIES-26]